MQTPAGTDGEGSVLIVTRLLAGVRIEPRSRTATVGVAAGRRQVLDAAEVHGLFAPAVVMGAVVMGAVVMGVRGAPAGATSTGPGFAAEHISAVQIVTAMGGLTWVDRHSDPARFERLLGGRGIGVVTALVVDLLPLPSVYGAALWLAAADANPVALQHYRDWAADLPANTSTSLSRRALPDDVRVPAALRGQEALRVGCVHLGNPADGARLVAPLRSAAGLAAADRHPAALVRHRRRDGFGSGAVGGPRSGLRSGSLSYPANRRPGSAAGSTVARHAGGCRKIPGSGVWRRRPSRGRNRCPPLS